jgi:hypothetical protein
MFYAPLIVFSFLLNERSVVKQEFQGQVEEEPLSKSSLKILYIKVIWE